MVLTMCTRPEHPAHGGVMLCTVQCRPASACARKSPPRGCTLKKQDKTRQDTVQCRPASACARKSPPRGCTLKKQEQEKKICTKLRKDFHFLKCAVLFSFPLPFHFISQSPISILIVKLERLPLLVRQKRLNTHARTKRETCHGMRPLRRQQNQIARSRLDNLGFGQPRPKDVLACFSWVGEESKGTRIGIEFPPRTYFHIVNQELPTTGEWKF